MQYVIVGADRETGEECRTIIEAGGKAEADQKARALGWLIESVTLDPTGRAAAEQAAAALDYMTPDPKRVRAVPSDAAAPNYDELEAGAFTLRVCGILVYWLGILVIIVSAGLSFVAIGQVGGIGLFYFFGGLFWGAMMIIGGILLKMLAALALAHRDLVRNSFTRAVP